MPERGTLLAFDFGTQRIGVAIGEALLAQARALARIDAADNKTRFAEIAALIAAWQPQALVVGLPLDSDGGEHEMSQRCRRFAHQLESRFGLPVHLVDERYSSLEAEAQLTRMGLAWRQRKRAVDAAAAAIILQDYLDGQSQRRAA